MKIATIRSKEFLILESLAYKNNTSTGRYLKNMHENFVIPYVTYLNKFAKRLNEADLSADQVNQLFQSISQDIQSSGSNETMLGKMLPDAIKKKFADSLPAADAGEVQGFNQQANTIVGQVQDPATKKGLMSLVKQGIQSPATQKLIIAAVQGIAGVATGALTGGLGGALGASAAGAISGGLLGIVASKMQGQDWKSAGKAGLQGAAVGAIGGLAGNMAATGASAALDATTNNNTLPASTLDTTTQQTPQLPAELTAGSAAMELKAAQEYAVADQAEKAEIRNVTGLTDQQLVDILSQQASQPPAQATPAAPDNIESAFGKLLRGDQLDANTVALLQSRGINISPDLQGFSPAKGSTPAESIDRNLTVRLWVLNERLGKHRGGVQLTEAGITDVVTSVKNWLQTKGQNITQKVTPDKLTQAWAKAGNPTDSEKVYQFLQNQEIPIEIIDRIYSTLKIPTAGNDTAATPVATGGGGAFGSIANQLGQATPTATPTATATPATPATGTVFDNPNKLLSDFNNYIKSGGTISPEVRAQLKNVLLTKFKVVESTKSKFTKMIKEANNISCAINQLKRRMI